MGTTRCTARTLHRSAMLGPSQPRHYISLLQAAQAALETAEGQKANAAAEAEAEAAEAEAEAPRARGWAAAAALSDMEGVVFGGLAGSDAAPERLGDAWRVRLEVEYYGTEDYI